MEFTGTSLALESFYSVTLAILVLFIGKGLNLKFAFLRNFNIPEPYLSNSDA